jgi:hypothetical protein
VNISAHTEKRAKTQNRGSQTALKRGGGCKKSFAISKLGVDTARVAVIKSDQGDMKLFLKS